MKNADPEETILVIKAQAGDKEAFDFLLRRVQLPLWRYVLNVVRDEHLAEDIVQNVFWIIYRKIGWLNEPSVFRPWAFRVASRESLKVLKKEQRWLKHIVDERVLETASSSESLPKDHHLIDDLPKLLDSLPPASRVVLTLHYLEEMTLAETASILDISAGTVKSRLAYGLSRLRNKLSQKENRDER